MRYLISSEDKEWTLEDMAEHLFNTATPGTVKMASGVFTGARRVLLDNHDHLIIPKKYLGRKAVSWRFARADDAEDKATVYNAMVRKDHTALGWEKSFQKSVNIAERKNLISSDQAQGLKARHPVLVG